MAAHAPFSPSASERWIACPASHAHSLRMPSAPSSEYADRGAAMHDMAAKLLLGSARKISPDFDESERAAIATYVAYAQGLIRASSYHAVEKVLRHSDELWGTSDLIALVVDTLHVADFKGGAGVAVDATDNPQLLTYAAMAYAELHPAQQVRVKKIRMTIIQPRLEGVEPIRYADAAPAALVEWRTVLTNAIAAAKAPGATYHAGAHCRFCPVKGVCPELMRAADKPVHLAGADLTAADVSELLGRAELAEEWIAGLRAFAQQALERGIPLPGWKLQPKRANRKWDDEKKVIAFCKTKKWTPYEQKLSSPAQMEKKYGPLPPQLQKNVTQESSGNNLVRDKDYRPANEAATGITEAYNRLKFFV